MFILDILLILEVKSMLYLNKYLFIFLLELVPFQKCIWMQLPMENFF